MSQKRLHSVNGLVEIDSLGLILPHEHLFTDLRGPYVPGYAQADPAAVVKVVQPYLEEASRAGVTAPVECSTVGVGRNIEVLCGLAQETLIHIVARPESTVMPIFLTRFVKPANGNLPTAGSWN